MIGPPSALLRLLGETLRANVRPYDVIVRYGGGELLCAMSNLGVPEAMARFEKIAAALRPAADGRGRSPLTAAPVAIDLRVCGGERMQARPSRSSQHQQVP